MIDGLIICQLLRPMAPPPNLQSRQPTQIHGPCQSMPSLPPSLRCGGHTLRPDRPHQTSPAPPRSGSGPSLQGERRHHSLQLLLLFLLPICVWHKSTDSLHLVAVGAARHAARLLGLEEEEEEEAEQKRQLMLDAMAHLLVFASPGLAPISSRPIQLNRLTRAYQPNVGVGSGGGLGQ